ncbi:hypothetical protein MBLNU230_g4284t1 [Neophaeotheca triangularis]
MTSGTNSPLSSAPPTPRMASTSSRRASQQNFSNATPTNDHANSPRTPDIRRTSSAMSAKGKQSSSPKLNRKSSRTSLDGDSPATMDNRPTPKRSISNLIAGMRERRTTMESIEEPVALTAPQIAIQHFTQELLAHSQPGVEAETAFIIHDACYGHRYSRQKTAKSTLSMIVERPERIHANILGASAAYVRMGQHYEGARNAPSMEKKSSEPPPFKIRRTQRSMDITSSCVTNVHGTAWMNELGGMCQLAGGKLAAGEKELSRIIGPGEMESEKRTLHEGDLYLSPESLNAFQGALGGVADAVDAVFDPGPTKRTFVAVRPPGHHCSADHPSGFCWLNNVHVGIEYAAQTHGLTHAAILDFDLHHGDGSQAITWERNSANNVKRISARPNQKLKLNPDIGYYSLHDINSYPCEMGDDEKVQAASLCIENSHGQNVWNVHLQPWKSEQEFWELYETRYKVLIEKARAFLRQQAQRVWKEGKVAPKAAIFISAGFDASEWEGSGMQRHKVNVPTEFYARFTRDLVALSQEEDTACDGRMVSVLEGGYSDRALCSGALSHIAGLCASPAEGIKQQSHANGGDDGLAFSMAGLSMNHNKHTSPLCYDKTWWSPEYLTALENKINPPPPPQAKKVRTGAQPTYATPTESFAYKVRDTEQFARSFSGTMREVPRPARPATPPPPEVDWVVATQELSKLLIPTDRQTKSFTPEELAPVRTKKERQSAMPALSSEDAIKPMKLRDRGNKVQAPPPPSVPESAHSDDLESMRSVSRSSRRITIADMPSAGESVAHAPQQQQQKQTSNQSRRSSVNTNISSLPDRGLNSSSQTPPVPSIPTTTNFAAAKGAMKPPPLPSNAAAATASAQARKPRAPAKPRKSPAPSTTPTSNSSHPSTSNPSIKAPASAPRPTMPPTTHTAPTAPTTSTASATHSDPLDALTTGMKRISIKVPPREEHDRRVRERLERERAERSARAVKGAETRRVNREARDREARRAREAGGKAAALAEAAPTAQQTASSDIMPHTGAAGAASNVGSSLAQQPARTETTTLDAAPTAKAPETAQIVPTPIPKPLDFNPQSPTTTASTPPPVPSNPAHTTPSTTQPYTAPTSSTPSAIPTHIPDSAARQLLHENENAQAQAQGQFSGGFGAISPERKDARKLPVWSATGVLPFARGAGQEDGSWVSGEGRGETGRRGDFGEGSERD